MVNYLKGKCRKVARDLFYSLGLSEELPKLGLRMAEASDDYYLTWKSPRDTFMSPTFFFKTFLFIFSVCVSAGVGAR